MKVINSTSLYASAGELRQVKVQLAFTILTFSSIFLQKLGFLQIGLNACILWIVLIWLYTVGVAVIVPSRLILFAILLAALMLSVLFSFELVSPQALLLLLVMYATFLFRVDVSQATLLRCFERYQNAVWWVAWIVIGQQVIQYTVGNTYWPNLDKIIPDFILVHGYNYLRPYSWNSPYLTPNGVFFLEPSSVSEYLATAVALELIWLRRLDRLALFTAATLLGVAGTGPTVLVVCAPLLLFNLDRRIVGWAVGLGVPLLVFAFASGLLGHYLDRSTEFYDNKASAYGRFVEPFAATRQLASDPDNLISGQGAGSSPKGGDIVQWPANKMIYEYGILSAILFHIFLLVAVLGSSANRTMTLIILIPHLFFGGGFVAHTNIMQLVMFGSLLRLVSARAEHVRVIEATSAEEANRAGSGHPNSFRVS